MNDRGHLNKQNIMTIVVWGTYVFRKVFPASEDEKEKAIKVKCYSDKCRGSEVTVSDAAANEWCCVCFVPLFKVKSTPYKGCPECKSQLFY